MQSTKTHTVSSALLGIEGGSTVTIQVEDEKTYRALVAKYPTVSPSEAPKLHWRFFTKKTPNGKGFFNIECALYATGYKKEWVQEVNKVLLDMKKNKPDVIYYLYEYPSRKMYSVSFLKREEARQFAKSMGCVAP